MNELSTEELRHELNNPGNWESLLKLADELFRRLGIAEAQVEELQRVTPEACPNSNCISGMEQFDSGASMTCGMCGGTGEYPDDEKASAR